MTHLQFLATLIIAVSFFAIPVYIYVDDLKYKLKNAQYDAVTWKKLYDLEYKKQK